VKASDEGSWNWIEEKASQREVAAFRSAVAPAVSV
jgi:hypothetical protein